MHRSHAVRSPNHDARPEDSVIDTLVLHYTGMKNGAAALERLCKPEAKVSSHYFIEEDGTVYELVPPEYRAWHAGRSIWRGRQNLNDTSIGIEIVNPGHEFGYRKFPEKQMKKVIGLCQKLVKEYNIPARNVIAHSDIAPSRKQDPGELFDWKLLAEKGVGLWSDKTVKTAKTLLKKGDEGRVVKELQMQLSRFGYGISADGIFAEQTECVVRAFQRHFGSTKKIDGVWNSLLQARLEDLLAQC